LDARPGRRSQVWVIGYVLGLWCAAASAQTFYKWTDDGGIVHFSDVPPPQAKGVEERHLPPLAHSADAEPEAAVGQEGNAGASAPAGAEGPAQVIVTTRQSPRIGPSAMHVVGEVKNVGGADAKNVAVAINAVDSTEGTPCLHQEATVSPSTLKPGESGNFDVDVDSPCLFGKPDLDVAPVWD
jgi:hypothetical protein